jgi:superfamily I DNA/RNA helicase
MPPREIMVLLSNVRAMGGELQEAFLDFGVPFEPPREARFKDTDAGRALLTVLRLAGARQDFVALRTLLALRRGVGISTADGIAEVAIDQDLTYSDLFFERLPEDAFAARQLTAMTAVREVAQELVEWSPDDELDGRRADLHHMIEAVLNREPDISWEDEAEAVPGNATLGELARYLSVEKDDEQAATLASIARRLGDESATVEEHLSPRVRVMTMHGSKGLSAQMVFIPGLEEELLPGEARKRYVGQVLESARMLFVSVTRARLGCIVSFADRRVVNGRTQPQHPSRFTASLGRPFERRTSGIDTSVARAAVEASANL